MMIEINKIYFEDCLLGMQKIPDKSVDLILCDPPYGTTQCKWDVIIPFEPLWKELKRIRKDTATVAIFGTEPFSTLLRMSNFEEFKYDWIWMKNQPTGIGYAKYRPMSNHEIISVFVKNKNIYNAQLVKSKITDRGLGKSNGKFTGTIAETTGMMAKKKDNPDNILREMVKPRTILEFPVVPHSKGILHPTQKPTDLLEYLIKTYTNENDLVMDFCMGSGSTAVACQNISRNFVGFEKDEKYFNIAVERINKNRV